MGLELRPIPLRHFVRNGHQQPAPTHTTPAACTRSMIRLEDNSTATEPSSSSLNDLSTLKTLQGSEKASTPVAIAMVELVTAIPEGPNGITFSLANIKLHSPSTIVGTPLDPSSRFEYPFPSPPSESEPRNLAFFPPKSSDLLSTGPTCSSPPRQSFVHPKLEANEVPIPPTLSMRRKIELTYPLSRGGINLLGNTRAPIRRRTNVDNVDDPAKES